MEWLVPFRLSTHYRSSSFGDITSVPSQVGLGQLSAQVSVLSEEIIRLRAGGREAPSQQTQQAPRALDLPSAISKETQKVVKQDVFRHPIQMVLGQNKKRAQEDDWHTGHVGSFDNLRVKIEDFTSIMER